MNQGYTKSGGTQHYEEERTMGGGIFGFDTSDKSFANAKGSIKG